MTFILDVRGLALTIWPKIGGGSKSALALAIQNLLIIFLMLMSFKFLNHGDWHVSKQIIICKN
jgi:hypothetical protein